MPVSVSPVPREAILFGKPGISFSVDGRERSVCYPCSAGPAAELMIADAEA